MMWSMNENDAGREDMKEYRYRHTSMRVRALAGREFTLREYEQLCDLISSGRIVGEPVQSRSDSLRYPMTIRGVAMYVVWRWRERLIVTAYLRENAEVRTVKPMKKSWARAAQRRWDALAKELCNSKPEVELS